ncbi:acyl-CoA thioesterase [Streptomyces sp. L7]
MNQALQDLLDLLDLEQIEENIFRGESRSAVVPASSGARWPAQALVAAGRTVPADRYAHSLHAYFLRPGDPARSIVYTVERIRDGRSFTTRRVLAVQHGRPIFALSASFQAYEEGLDHQAPCRRRRTRRGCPRAASGCSATTTSTRGSLNDSWRRVRRSTSGTSTTRRTAGFGEPREPHSQVWFRTNGKLADDPSSMQYSRRTSPT